VAKLTKDLSKQVAIRMENDLLAMLKADAAANGRTVAQSIRFLLRKALEPKPTVATTEVDWEAFKRNLGRADPNLPPLMNPNIAPLINPNVPPPPWPGHQVWCGP
jgi:hypothetical protein